jgi:hypothetical protein
MTTKVPGDKDYPCSTLSLSASELAFLRPAILKDRQVEERE